MVAQTTQPHIRHHTPRPMSRKLFCEISPFTYAVSQQKEIWKRHLKDFIGREKYAKHRDTEPFPVCVHAYSNGVIKHGQGIEPELQQGKAHNIRLACAKINGLVIRPGETFSFWHTVGKTSRRRGFQPGRVIVNGRLTAGEGGGLCNLANTITLLVLHSPLTITELHHHSDALAPDPNGQYEPYRAGTSVNYNYIDLRFRNDSNQPVQLLARCKNDILQAELRAHKPFAHTYRLTAEDHHFQRQPDGSLIRHAIIYRETLNPADNQIIDRQLLRHNHSRVLYDPALVPTSQIRE